MGCISNSFSSPSSFKRCRVSANVFCVVSSNFFGVVSTNFFVAASSIFLMFYHLIIQTKHNNYNH